MKKRKRKRKIEWMNEWINTTEEGMTDWIARMSKNRTNEQKKNKQTEKQTKDVRRPKKFLNKHICRRLPTHQRLLLFSQLCNCRSDLLLLCSIRLIGSNHGARALQQRSHVGSAGRLRREVCVCMKREHINIFRWRWTHTHSHTHTHTHTHSLSHISYLIYSCRASPCWSGATSYILSLTSSLNGACITSVSCVDPPIYVW